MASGDEQVGTSIRVWDLPTRLFHWALAVLVGISVYTGLAGDPMLIQRHMVVGQVILGLVLFRLAWGVLGSRRSRFTDFVRGPGALIRYVRRGVSPTPGHNPLGAGSVLALLAALAFQAGTGLFANDDIFNEGPLAAKVGKDLSDTLTGLHHQAANVLIALVALHLAAIAFYRFKGENLIRPMLTGRKDVPPGTSWEDAPYVPLWRAAVAAVLAAAAVYFGVRL